MNTFEEIFTFTDFNKSVFNEKKSIAIIFDGEIFNSKTLKGELNINENKTDVELVIHAYEQWGIEVLLNKLDGAYAFSINDIAKETIYIVRDKFGIKPLYYFQDKTGLYAASTLKLLTKHSFPKIISKEGLNLFFSLTYIPAPYTIYDNVFKLPAGNYITIHNDHADIKAYYRLEDHITPSTLTFEEAKERLNQMLCDSVKNLLKDDVTTGAFLSGGMDSSLVVGLMSQFSTKKPVQTFSIGYKENEFDESSQAQLVSNAFNTKHTVHFLEYADVKEELDDIIDYFNEPFGDMSAIPTYYVAKLAKEKVNAVLGGDGPDEIFGGYNKYLSEYYSEKYLLIPKPVRYLFEKTIGLLPDKLERISLIRKIKKLIINATLSKFEFIYQSMCMGCSDKERLQLMKPEFYADIKPFFEKTYNRFKSNDEINKAMLCDISIYLEGDGFPKVERMWALSSLTAHSPFLSADMINFAISLPSSYKINGKKRKYIIQETFKDLLPAKVRSYKKHGFRAPLTHWLKKELKQDLLNLLNKEKLTKQGILNADIVSSLVEEHLKGNVDNGQLLWNLLVFEKWYAKNMQI